MKAKNGYRLLIMLAFLMQFIALKAQPPPCASNPIANDYCSSATAICNLNGYCGNTSAFYTNHVSATNANNETNTPLGAVFCATIQNNSWLKFIADSTVAIFSVWCSNCANNHGIQMQIYATTNCYNYTSVSNCWNPGYPTNGQIIATGLTPGTVYYFMIDGTGGDICDYVIACSAGVNAAPAVSLDTTICVGQSVTVSATGGLSYSWTSSPNDPSLSGQQNNQILNVSPTTTTVYSVTVVNPGLNTFCATDTMLLSTVVNVNSVAGMTTGVIPDYCDQHSGALTVMGTGGNGSYTYLWNTSPAQTTPTISGLTAGTYTVTISSGGCSKTLNSVVSDYPSPIASIASFSDSYCNQSNGTATVQVNGGQAPYTFVWNTVPPQTTNILDNVGGGTYTVTVTDSVNCTDTETVTIANLPGPVVTMTSLPTLCLNHSAITLSGGSPAGGTYSGTGVSNNVFNPLISGPGNFVITYSYTDAQNCSGTTTQPIQVLSLPVVTLSPQTSVCASVASFALSGGSPAGGTYSGNGVVGGVFNPQVSGAGTYVITYTYTDANTCTAFASQNLVIKPLPVVSMPAINPICIDALPLTLFGGYPVGGTYSGPGVTNAIFYPLVTGTGVFQVTYAYNDPNGCSASTIQNLAVNPLPAVFPLYGGGIICEGSGGLEVGMDSSQNGMDYYLYINGQVLGFAFSGTGSSFSFGNQETEGYYTVQALDPVGGCFSNMLDTIRIHLLPRPKVEIGDVMYLCDLPQIQLDGGTYQDSVTYAWQDGSVNRFLSVFEPGFYWVNVVLGNCNAEDTIEIKDCSELVLPNVFTPNDDGKNDRFKPKINGEISEYKIQIFNRWGKEVYESSDAEDGWNGKNFNNGGENTEGVYFFIAYYTAVVFPQPDRKSKITGSVTLMR